eukprot:scaffold5642_cov86-Skeletonema_marinoi.AAC.3
MMWSSFSSLGHDELFLMHCLKSSVERVSFYDGHPPSHQSQHSGAFFEQMADKIKAGGRQT